MTVAEAARELGLTEQQIRRLVRTSVLAGQRLGREWLVDAARVPARARTGVTPGRPVSSSLAWTILRVVQAAIDATDGEHRDTAHASNAIDAAIDAVPDHQLRYRLRTHVASAPPVSRWPQWLRSRATAHAVWVHPGVIDRLIADERVRTSTIDLRQSALEPVLYVEAADLDALLADFRAQHDRGGPLRFMAIPTEVPDALLPERGQPLPSAVSMLDLVDHPDARPRHQATEVLSSARDIMSRAVRRRTSARRPRRSAGP